jgi:hypothetical protein
VPPVQVHALWHRKRQQDSTHQWLRTQLQQVAQQAFDGHMPTSATTTTAIPTSDIPT